MPLSSVGTSTDAILLFNSAKLTIDGIEVADISNVTVNETFEGKETRILNSIKKKYLRRANLNQEITFEINAGLYKKIIDLFYSSSSPDTDGDLYTVKDGQQTPVSDVTITGYEDDDTTKPIQYQVVNALFTQHNPTFASQEFGTVPVTVMCTEIKMFVDSDVTS